MKYSLLAFFLPFTGYPYEGEHVPCPACGHASSTRICNIDRRLKRLPTFACDACGLLFTNPMPTERELGVYYSQFYRFDYQAAAVAPKGKHLRKRHAEAAARIGQVDDLLAKGARTLDFGCGSGEFVTGMLAKGHDAHGFEPGETYGNHARSLHGDRIKVKGWQDVAYKQKFDLVTCFHVLEHLRNPFDALKQMAEWTWPNGLVYVEVPDLGVEEPSKGFGAFHFAHLLGFNHHNLLIAASRAGLHPKRIVAPTGIIFEHGTGNSIAEEARKGRELSRRLYSDGRAVSNYLKYQLGKITGENRRAAARRLARNG